jgi:hypothetical protein|tara:strand:- start:973 stop:1107 length:135 start_codon:yes stop_codon:yes gene_type:complete
VKYPDISQLEILQLVDIKTKIPKKKLLTGQDFLIFEKNDSFGRM